MSRNAESGPSRLRGLSISGSSSSSASPINAIDELDDLKDYGQDLGHMGHIQPHQYASGQYAHISPQQLQQGQAQGHAHTQGQGQGQAGQGINRNGLRVAEDGEVTRVPAFLTKLFSMVSDAETDKLIYWSPNGDSFLIPNHEQFSQNILPRFFKHKNFSSFVRQLNMYAFHKVPHLQSNSTAESSPEIWEFVNPLFKRNQPELLGRITRRQRGNVPAPAPTRTSARQQAASVSTPTAPGSGSTNTVYGSNGQPLHLITDGSVEGDASFPTGTSSSGNNQMLVGPQGMIDLAAITSGIQAIQRTQASIGADLKALQASNEHLWREAMEQREKHKKHQETIDLIVSFLERLFGTDGEGLKGLKEAMRRSGLARSRDTDDAGASDMPGGKKRRRLGLDRMIGDGKEDTSGNAQLVEISSDTSRSHSQSFTPRLSRNRSSRASSQVVDGDWNTSQRFTTLPNDESSPTASMSKEPSPPDAAPAGTIRPSAMHGNSGTGGRSHAGGGGAGTAAGGQSVADSIDDLFAPYSTAGGTLTPYNYGNSNTSTTNPLPSFNPSASLPDLSSTSTANLNSLALMSPGAAQSAAAAFNLDPSILQTTIGSLLQSPAAAQMFLSSLNNSVQGQSLTPMRGVFTPGLGGSGVGGMANGHMQYGSTGNNDGNGGNNGNGTKNNGQGAYTFAGSGGAMLNGNTNSRGNTVGAVPSSGDGGNGYFGQAFSPGADFTNAALGHFGGTSTSAGGPSSGTNAYNVANNATSDNTHTSDSNSTSNHVGMYDDPTLALLSPLPMPSQDALLDNQANLMRTYQTAAGMEGDMDKLQESIDQLVRSMGLDIPGGVAGMEQLQQAQGQSHGMQAQGHAVGQVQTPSQAQQQGKGSADMGKGVQDVKVEPVDTPVSTASAGTITPTSAPLRTAGGHGAGQTGMPKSALTSSAQSSAVHTSASTFPSTSLSNANTGSNFDQQSDLSNMVGPDLDLGPLDDGNLDLSLPEGFDMDAFLHDLGGDMAGGNMGTSAEGSLGTGAAP